MMTHLTKTVCFSLLLLFTANYNNVFGQISASDTAICFGDSAVLTADTLGYDEYIWSPDSLISGSDSGMSITAIPVDTTIYYLFASDTAAQTTDTFYITIHVTDTLPVLAIDTHQTETCVMTPGLTTVSGAENYHWIDPQGVLNNPGNSATVNPVLQTVNDTATYHLTGDIGGCASQDTLSFTVEPLPRPQMSVTFDDSLCKGDTTLVELSGAQNYEWTSGQEILLSGSPTDSSRTFEAHPNFSSANNNYTIIGSNGQCFDTLNIRIYVQPSVPNVTEQEHQNNICFGQQGETEVSGSFSFHWIDPQGVLDTLEGGVVFPTAIDSVNDMSYYVVGTSGICSTDTVEFTINGLPIPELSITQSSMGNPICRFGMDTLNITFSSDQIEIIGNDFTKLSKETMHAFSVQNNETLEIVARGVTCSNREFITLTLDPTCTDSTIFFLSTEELQQLDLDLAKVYQSGNQIVVESEIDFNDQEFILFDMSGKTVSTQRLSQGRRNILQLPGNVNQGIYIYHIRSKNGVMNAGKLPLMNR